jgi:hypothetical protein
VKRKKKERDSKRKKESAQKVLNTKLHSWKECLLLFAIVSDSKTIKMVLFDLAA